ncbi:TPA: SGNH/GDSL hydrolase family protein, partial [Klebsiella pneumoniae]|nr:SGNH/GDSL hydrolase family protein [Klebsiella pneumoniae]
MNISEKAQWEDHVTMLTRLDKVEGGWKGAANTQAIQLANRTSWLKEAVESASDYREYTFYITESDPDGTIAGIANTPAGKFFRVAMGVGSNISFRYFLNDSGIAKLVAELIGKGSLSSFRL